MSSRSCSPEWALDSYGRLRGSTARRWFVGETDGPRVLFVDADLVAVSAIEAERLADELRSLPSDVVNCTKTVLVRFLPSLTEREVLLAFLDSATVAMRRLGYQGELGAVAFEGGQQLRVQRFEAAALEAARPLDAETEQRIRSAELQALLTWGKAVWTPMSYHYRLPNGTHSDRFIRLADAVRHPSDALALASWALPHTADLTAIVTDSSSMTPVVLALHDVMRRSGMTPGRVALLEHYPPNHIDTYKAVRDVARPGEPVLGILSVHSTGNVRDRLLDALRTSALGSAHLEVVVDKGASEVPPLQEYGGVTVNSWFAAGATIDTDPDHCAVCRDPDRNRVVQIDPRTFGGMVLPVPDMVVPSTRIALQSRRLWEIADEADAIVVEGAPDVAGSHPRHGATKLMAVKVDFDRLLHDDQWDRFGEACWERLAEVDREGRLLRGYDVVVIDASDQRRENFDRFLDDVLDGRAQEVIVFDAAAEDPFTDPGAVAAAERVLIFRLGAVSGLSLQQMLVAVQDRCRARASGADIDGIVCHLRPTSLRRRQTLQNSFGGRQHFAPLWESVLPEDRRSPLQDEQDVLSRIDEDDLDDDVRRFIDDRRNICASPGMRDSVLWGISDLDGAAGRLSPHSVFGESLRARAAYAAIGSAVHDARMHGERDRGAPLWRQFEITAIASSYYDPIILACIFRWMQPGEIWWGDRPTDASAAITDMIHRTGDGRALLMSELLLATAEGKVVTAAAEALEALAGAFIAAYPDEQSLCLRGGLAVLDASRSG